MGGGVGEAAYRHSGHLYVLNDDMQVDVYSRGDGDDEMDARAVATAVIERL